MPKMYTSIDRVRTLSGFNDTENITDELVKTKINIAGSYIDSSAGTIYSLPFSYRYTNFINFYGKATSSGTLSISVGGISYNVSISVGDVGENVADKFRIACNDNDSFTIDDLGSGSEVFIISKSNSENVNNAYSEVEIIGENNFGIKTSVGKRVKKYPNILEQICGEIATALLLIDIYGIESQDTGKDGQTRMEIINETLQKLQGVHESGQKIRIFDDVTKTELGFSQNIISSSIPNDTTNISDDPTSPKVGINKIF